jgi:hypothetical protein
MLNLIGTNIIPGHRSPDRGRQPANMFQGSRESINCKSFTFIEPFSSEAFWPVIRGRNPADDKPPARLVGMMSQMTFIDRNLTGALQGLHIVDFILDSHAGAAIPLLPCCPSPLLI